VVEKSAQLEDDLVERFVDRDRAALAKIISLIEDGSPRGYAIYRRIYGRGKEAYRIGITGPIGVGKSTLIAELSRIVRSQAKETGIVAIDPTSPFSDGALLGDRVRMGDLAMDEGVFIRSMATRGGTGGLARATRMVVDVLEAFGKEIILVETVGVGQSELDIRDSVDTSVVVLMPQMGDSIQVMKAGLMEIADVFVLNKSDQAGSEAFLDDLNHFLDLCEDERAEMWKPPVIKTQANKGVGVEQFYHHLEKHLAFSREKHLLEERKKRRLFKQIKGLFLEDLEGRIWERFDMDERIHSSVDRIFRQKSNPVSETERLAALTRRGGEGQ